MAHEARHLRLARIVDEATERSAQLQVHHIECTAHGWQQWRAHFVGDVFDGRCPRCKAAEETRARRIEAFHIRLDSDAGARHRGATLDGFECATPAQRAAVVACRAFAAARPDGAGLVLLGPPGTGKTTLAVATCRAWIDAQVSTASVVTQRELIAAMRATWRKDAKDTEAEVVAEFVGTGLLVLDDAGIGHGTDAELTQLLDVIDGRYRRNRPTLVSSNLAVPQLRDAIGERVFDRLREGARFVVCDWPSFRAGKGF